jgi:hypothetical protein
MHSKRTGGYYAPYQQSKGSLELPRIANSVMGQGQKGTHTLARHAFGIDALTAVGSSGQERSVFPFPPGKFADGRQSN